MLGSKNTKTTSNKSEGEIVIRSGIPIPPLRHKEHKVGPITAAMRKMQIGDCIDLDVSVKNINQRGQSAGMRCTARLVTDENGKEIRRVWKVGELKHIKKRNRRKYP